MITPIQAYNHWWVKRDDLAQDSDQYSHPTGSKVRQFLAMAKDAPGVPMVVGCAATSAMQVYVAWAAKHTGVDAHVIVAARKNRSASTQYAIDMGANVTEVRPGYTSVLRARAKAKVAELGGAVRWNFKLAVEDAAAQVVGIPDGVKRIVIPTGSGLTAMGVLVGLYRAGLNIPVEMICVSGLADPVATHAKAIDWVYGKQVPGGFGIGGGSLPPFQIKVGGIVHPTKYAKPVHATLPCGSPLDPYYAAKAKDYIVPGAGDMLWVPGCRPAVAF